MFAITCLKALLTNKPHISTIIANTSKFHNIFMTQYQAFLCALNFSSNSQKPTQKTSQKLGNTKVAKFKQQQR